MLAVVIGVLLVLSAATWSAVHAVTAGPVVGPDELALDGGIVHVERAISAARPQHAMPGMGTDDDPVADGYRRISVDVTLVAGSRPMEYTAGLFGLTVDGEAADRLTHRDVLPGDVLPGDSQLSGSIMFDVPADATTGVLSYDGDGAVEVALPAEQEQSVPAPGTTGDGGAAPHETHESVDGTGGRTGTDG